MARVTTPEQRIVAVLHDVLEDTPFTLSDLAREGFPLKILAALLALSRREGESYQAFVIRLGVDPLAREVKLADLADNRPVAHRLSGPGGPRPPGPLSAGQRLPASAGLSAVSHRP
jgi:hypothetical protein